MSNYEMKKDELFNKHIDDVLDAKVKRLVNTQDMPDGLSNWHRGYIAATRDLSDFYNNDLKRKANEA